MSEEKRWYHLVEWKMEEGEMLSSVSIVPDKWLVMGTNKCQWPPYVSTNLIRRNPSPQRTWETYEYVRIVKSSADWERMKRWEKTFSEKTDFETTDISDQERSRKRKRIPRVNWDSPRSRSSTPSLPEHSPARNHHPSPASGSSNILARSPPPPPPPRSATRPFQENVPSLLRHRSRSPISRPVATVDYRPYFEALLKNQEQMRAAFAQQQAELQGLRGQVRRLEAAVAAGVEADETREETSRPELPQGYIFPLTSVQELERLDRELANNAVRRRMERHLYNLGGATFRASLRAAGATLLSPGLQGGYNVTGSNKMGHNKAAFNKLTQVHRVLYDAVHQRHQVDRQMFNSYLSDWLCTWRDRVVGGKKNRVGERKKNGGGGGRNIDGEVLNAEGEAGARYNESVNIWSGSVEDRGGGNDRGIQYRRVDEDGSQR